MKQLLVVIVSVLLVVWIFSPTNPIPNLKPAGAALAKQMARFAGTQKTDKPSPAQQTRSAPGQAANTTVAALPPSPPTKPLPAAEQPVPRLREISYRAENSRAFQPEASVAKISYKEFLALGRYSRLRTLGPTYTSGGGGGSSGPERGTSWPSSPSRYGLKPRASSSSDFTLTMPELGTSSQSGYYGR